MAGQNVRSTAFIVKLLNDIEVRYIIHIVGFVPIVKSKHFSINYFVLK